jgi:[acyl-carrier-protein] S-malonyltransferase
MSRIAFLFPGQGAQTVGMMRGLLETWPQAKERFDFASTVLGYDLLDVCLNGPKERLDLTNVSQPAIFVSSYVALESLRQSEPELISEVMATAGLSLGEYTALVFAGSLSFEDGLTIVKERGEAMQAAAEAEAGGMISLLAIDLPLVEEIVTEANQTGFVKIANYLCPGNTVVSGSKAGCEAVEKIVEIKGGKAVKLAVAGAFHTHLMAPASERLQKALDGVTLNPPKLPLYFNVDAKPHTDSDEIKEALAKQLTSPVQWEMSLRSMLEAGVEKFVEIGPGRVLAGLLKRINRKIECRNISI